MTNAAKKALREQNRTDRKPAPKWDKSDLAAFYAGHDAERKAKDAGDLSRLFNLAAKVPALKEALDWAKDNDIDIIIDRKSRGVGGYYWTGSGVVALSMPALSSDSMLAGVAVHEIRHAWQDRYGMIPTADYAYADYNIKIALIEADAKAHQKFAEKQTYAISSRESYEAARKAGKKGLWMEAWEERLRETEQSLSDPMAVKWGAFQGWYGGTPHDLRLSGVYGDATMKTFGKRLGIPGVSKPDFNFEFNLSSSPVITGLDFQRPEQLRRLGKGFRGGNYLNKAGAEGLPRFMLSHEASDKFFRTSQGSGVQPTVKEIRRRELRLRAHKGSRVLVTVGG